MLVGREQIMIEISSMNIIFSFAAIFIITNSFLCLFRTIKGPTIQDRLLGINIIGTKTLSVLVLVTFIFNSSFFLDVAIVYGLLNFIITTATSRYLEKESLRIKRVDY
jgi:multicomponent Na+:H+ antiporter subunit F